MQRKVTVSGAIYYPGVYALQGPNETITDILDRAGGLRPKAYPEASTLTRDENIILIALEIFINQA